MLGQEQFHQLLCRWLLGSGGPQSYSDLSGILLRRILSDEIVEMTVSEALSERMLLHTCHNWCNLRAELRSLAVDPQNMFDLPTRDSPCVYLDSVSCISRGRQRQRDGCSPGICSPVSPNSRVSSRTLWSAWGQVSRSNMLKAAELAQPNVCTGEIPGSDLQRKEVLCLIRNKGCGCAMIKQEPYWLFWNRDRRGGVIYHASLEGFRKV